MPPKDTRRTASRPRASLLPTLPLLLAPLGPWLSAPPTLQAMWVLAHAALAVILLQRRARRREQAVYRQPLEAMRAGVADRLAGDLLADLPDSEIPELREMRNLWEHLLAAWGHEGETMEAMRIALIAIHREGHIERANLMAVRLFRYQNSGEFVLEPAEVLFPNEEDLRWLLAPRESTSASTPTREAMATRADGGAFQAEIEVVERTESSVVLRCTDITHKKELEAAMERARDTALHTAELQAQFLANMSHEIRTPVNGILGMAQALLETKLTGEAQESAEIIHSCGQTLLTLINDILDLSKLDAGRVVLDARPTSLRKLSQEVVTLLEPRAEDRGNYLELDFPIHDSIPEHADVDPVRLRQVLLNLVGNAIKFTQNGSVCLRVRCHDLQDGRGQFTFEVEDTGIGIPEDRLDQIFERFVQAEKSTTRKFGGTGLGLPISKQLANLMGGDITVMTSPEGTLFRVILPLTVATPERTTGLRQSQPPVRIDGLRVLVAEDNPVNQKITSRILHKLGCTVQIVEDGAQAANAAASGDIDLVLMDCMMPEVDGYEGTRRIRAMETSSDARLPVIALTARAMDGDRDRCLAAGMDDYLTKPFSLAALRAVLVRWAASPPPRKTIRRRTAHPDPEQPGPSSLTGP